MNNLNLNLLPRKPFVKQYFRQIVTVATILALVPFSIMTMGYILDSIDESSLKAEISEMDNRVQVMSKRLQTNHVNASYEELQQLLADMERTQTTWQLLIGLIEYYLPEEAGYNSISIKGVNAIEGNFSFNRMSDVIGYIAKLEQDKIVKEVKITSITRNGEELNPSAYSNDMELSIEHTVNITIVFGSK